jgi:hypothetical protein
MKQTLIILITLISTVCMLIGQSKYSGIYKVTARYMGESASGLSAITAGGRMYDGDEDEYNTDPYKSVVTSKGKFSAITYDRSISLVGSIDSKFNVNGTIKSGGVTLRFSGKRVLK